MNQERFASRPALAQRALALLVSSILWVLLTVLAFACVFALRELLMRGLGDLLVPPGASMRQAAALLNMAQYCLVMLLGMVALIVTLVGAEFAFRRPGSLRSLLITLAVEGTIVILPALLV